MMKSARGQTSDDKLDRDEPQTPAQKLEQGVRQPLPKWGIACLVLLNYVLQLLVLGVEAAWVSLMVVCIALYGSNSQFLSFLGAIVLLFGLWIFNRVWLFFFNEKIPQYKKVHQVKLDKKKRG